MNRKILALNLGLLALLATLGWMLRQHWLETRAQELAMLAKRPRAKALLPPPSPTPPEAVVPANYLEVAQRTLFSKDRNPDVIIEVVAPPPPKPEEPPPARPEYYGQMGLGDPVAFLSPEKGIQKGFHVGEKVGAFKLIAFNRETITLEWKGKTLQYPLAELKPKEAAPLPPGLQGLPAGQSVAVGSIIGDKPNLDPALGPLVGETRGCKVDDKSPAGTVKDGFRKVIVPGMFGNSCQWEPVK